MVSETRTIDVLIRREELVIEQHPVDRRPVDGSASTCAPERTCAIRIEEESVVYRRPVVVGEITVGKRMLQETQTVSDTTRRKEAHIEPHGDASVHDR